MSEKVFGTFTGMKINKIRWRPNDNSESEYYATGSWGNKVNDISVYHYDKENPIGRPTRVSSHKHFGDVTELQFINEKVFLASSSLGSVSLFRIDAKDGNQLKVSENSSWNNIHQFKTKLKSSCTGLACFEEDFVTIGEDGRIVLLTAKRETPTRVIEEADSCSLRCVCFLKHNSILTGNLRGQMKIWDLKSSSTKAASTFCLSGDYVGASCVTQHPSQRHMVVAGGEDGALTVWDLRHDSFPVTLLSAHADSVSEVQFHPQRPEHLFTCSASGEVWHWNSTSMGHSTFISSASAGPPAENPWLSSDAAKHRLEVFTLMPQLYQPINSLDVNFNHLICGCDNEATYLIRNIEL